MKLENNAALRALLSLKTRLGETGRYGVYLDLIGGVDFSVEEFGTGKLLFSVKNPSPRIAFDMVHLHVESLGLLKDNFGTTKVRY